MRPTKTEWIELESSFRSLALKWCQLTIDLYGEGETPRESELVKVGESSELFRETWYRHFNVGSIDLAEYFRDISPRFRSCRALLKDALRFTKGELKAGRLLKMQYGDSYHITSIDDENEYMEKAYELSSRRRFSLAIDDAAYALYVAWWPESLLIIPDNRPHLLRSLVVNPDFFTVISPRQFEELVAYIYEAIGCRVQLTQQSRDYGADVLVWHPAPFGTETLIAVQVKRYAKHRHVGIKELFELHGAVTHYHATTGHIVTTSDFTGPALKFADENRYNLVNYNKLYQEILQLFGRTL